MNVIKRYRLENGLTQEEMAERLNISQGAVNQYENGKRIPSVKVIPAIIKMTGCSLDDILSIKVAERSN